MLGKLEKQMLGGITGLVMSLFLILYHEIQQNQESLRRIEVKLNQLNHRGTGINMAEEAKDAKTEQNGR